MRLLKLNNMNNDINELLSIIRKTKGNYSNEAFIIEDDYEINDCLIKLYYFLIAGNDNPNIKMYEQQFLRAYKKLSSDKKEIIKEDLKKVLKKQKEENEKGEMKL